MIYLARQISRTRIAARTLHAYGQERLLVFGSDEGYLINSQVCYHYTNEQ